ncbi:MAG: hypothetical protein ACP5TL_01815 [Candidatus Micrarchaeia archaeon]
MANKLITINIRKYLINQPRTKRIRKAVKYVEAQVARHAKVSIENVRISRDLNELIFKYGARRMTPLKLNIALENGIATASPFKEASAPSKKASTEQSAKPEKTKESRVKSANQKTKAGK